MDWSDEITYSRSDFCPHEPLTVKCDDHKCPSKKWSCGDGQCIFSMHRLVYQTLHPKDTFCFSMREYNHICETAIDRSLWTRSDGHCMDKGFLDRSLVLSSSEQKCLYLIRCALSKGAEAQCPCNGPNCAGLMEDVCDRRIYHYPERGIIRPWLVHLYDWERSLDSSEPTLVVVSGGLRCRGFYANVTAKTESMTVYQAGRLYKHVVELMVCHDVPLKQRDETSKFQYSATCWNDSVTFNGLPYAFQDVCPGTSICFSQYRIGDGYSDCVNDESQYLLANSYCGRIQKHRFRCSPQQMTCFPVEQFDLVGTVTSCTNYHDRFLNGDGRPVAEIVCRENEEDNECQLIRYYVGNSSVANSTFKNDTVERRNAEYYPTAIPFQYHCDTFWDEGSPHADENSAACQQWLCEENQFRCRTGQCIELSWVCDGQWDCSDASDEFGLHEHWSDHNDRLENLDQRKQICEQNHAKLPFSHFCNFDYQYPCYRASVPDPLNIYTYRPCINLTQIGDGVEDCYGGIDEKNTLEDCHGFMLGYSLRCGNRCSLAVEACEEHTDCATSLLCSYQSRNQSWCSKHKDVVCLDGTCADNSRCDGKYQCRYGEDEHWCSSYASFDEKIIYRLSKYQYRHQHSFLINLLPFPTKSIHHVHVTKNTSSSSTTNPQLSRRYPFESDQLTHATSVPPFGETTSQFHPRLLYVCNRGFPFFIRATDDYYCVCPPTYYGKRCEFFSDRLSVVTHLDLTTLPGTFITRWIKVLATLHYEETVVDHHLFHVNPSLEASKYVKQRFHLLYSRSNNSLEQKQWRYFNRTNIIHHQPYFIHFVVFSWSANQTDELGSFRYPIYFDFLPVFRLATVLKFPSWFSNSSLDPCAKGPCKSEFLCKPIFNRNQSFYCVCKPGYSGALCEKFDLQCTSYCSAEAICRPNSRGLIDGSARPLCICPPARMGPRCYLRNEACSSNPCRANGTCHLTYDLSGENPIICQCTQQFYGDRCQYEKVSIRIAINASISAAASVIQFHDIFAKSLSFVARHQEVVRGVPDVIRYHHGQQIAPAIALLKVYQDAADITYFVLYFQPNATIINITATPEECPYALNLLPKDEIVHTRTVFAYHHICRNNISRFCFYDLNYFCFCQPEHKRARCFGHNPSTDRCDSCLSDGKCIKGSLQLSNDFVCLCRSCHQGRQCEFNSQLFSRTVDSLLSTDLMVVQSIYTGLVIIMFSFGLFTNFCSFVTFKRVEPRKLGVGNYLLAVTVLNQFSLLCLLFKFIQILLASVQLSNGTSCKVVSYLLSVCTRSTYWLTSWIAVDRLLLVLFPAGILLKRPRLAIYSSLITLVGLLAMHVHEIYVYRIIRDPDLSVSLCVIDIDRDVILNYNRVNTFIHHMLPFSGRKLPQAKQRFGNY
ncbi:unnamed protein product [Adineta ricciae]|uniref:EGF-like domain-containing protein n=1 Tax=Adineta ricciae TaxID=249248 RepID=A0A816BM55_ADIRI|nr:unnamed protein product [Adineta ricciae]CAF1612533.1 unnamed protein product [Adineta ricciae]